MNERLYSKGRAEAAADWKAGAVNILALIDWGPFGEGYRAQRNLMRLSRCPGKEPQNVEGRED